MCQARAITCKNMPPSAILGTCHHFRNFNIKTIYSSNYLVFPLTIIRSTSKWFYYILLKWFVELCTNPYASLDCKFVERVLWWYSASTAVRGAKPLSITNGESKLLPLSAVSSSYQRGVQEMVVEVKCTLTGSEIALFLLPFQSSIHDSRMINHKHHNREKNRNYSHICVGKTVIV